MPEAYLTIDDSPSPRTGQISDYLEDRNLQALFFCRGDFMEEYPQAVINILEKGHILGNHLYSHQPASQLGYNKVVQEILNTEALIDQAYAEAKKSKPGKYLRFPYIDRGNGERTEQVFYELIRAVQSGSPASLNENDLVGQVQDFLKEEGYIQPFEHITHPLYKVPEIANAADCLLTFTSYDWMLSPRHKGKKSYKNLEDLKKLIDADQELLKEDGVNIVLFHDDREGIVLETCALIDHMISCGITFKEY